MKMFSKLIALLSLLFIFSTGAYADLSWPGQADTYTLPMANCTGTGTAAVCTATGGNFSNNATSTTGTVSYVVADTDPNPTNGCTEITPTNFQADTAGTFNFTNFREFQNDGVTQCTYTITLEATDGTNTLVTTVSTPPNVQYASLDWPGETLGYASYYGKYAANTSSTNPGYQGKLTFKANASVPGEPSAVITYTAQLIYYTSDSQEHELTLTNPTVDSSTQVGVFSFTLPGDYVNANPSDSSKISHIVITASAAGYPSITSALQISLTAGRAIISNAVPASDTPRYDSSNVNAFYPTGYYQPTTYGAQFVSRHPIQYGMLVVTMKPSEQRGMVSSAYTFEYHPPFTPASQDPWQWNEIDFEFVRNTLQSPRYYQKCSLSSAGQWDCDTAYDDLMQAYENGTFNGASFAQYELMNPSDAPTNLSPAQAAVWAARAMPSVYGSEWMSGIPVAQLGTAEGHDDAIGQMAWSNIQFPPLFQLAGSNDEPPYFNSVSFDIWNVARHDPGTLAGWRGTTGTVDANTTQDYFMPKTTNDADLYDDFHTYTMVWTPTQIAFYVDAPAAEGTTIPGTGISKVQPVYVRNSVTSTAEVKAAIKLLTSAKGTPDFSKLNNQMFGLQNMGTGNIRNGDTTSTIYDYDYNNNNVSGNAQYNIPWPNIMANIWTDGYTTDRWLCGDPDDPYGSSDPHCGGGGWGGMVPIQFTQGAFDPAKNQLPQLNTSPIPSGSNYGQAQGVTAVYYKSLGFFPLKYSGGWAKGDSFSDFIDTPPPAGTTIQPGEEWGDYTGNGSDAFPYAFITDFTKIQNVEQMVDAGWFISNNAYGQSMTANVDFGAAFTPAGSSTQGHYLALCDTYLPDYMPKIDWSSDGVTYTAYDWPLLAKGCSLRYFSPTKDGDQAVYLVVKDFGIYGVTAPSTTTGLANVSLKSNPSTVLGYMGGLDGWTYTDSSGASINTSTIVKYAIPGSEAQAKTYQDSKDYPADSAQAIYHNSKNIGNDINVLSAPPGEYLVNPNPSLSVGGQSLVPTVCIDGKAANELNVQMGSVGSDRVYYADIFWAPSGTTVTCPAVGSGGDPLYKDMNQPNTNSLKPATIASIQRIGFPSAFAKVYLSVDPSGGVPFTGGAGSYYKYQVYANGKPVHTDASTMVDPKFLYISGIPLTPQTFYVVATDSEGHTATSNSVSG